MAIESIMSCQACGASVYPEHVEHGQAGYFSGQLLCTVCFGEKRDQADEAADVGLGEPIKLESDEAKPAVQGSTAIRAFGGAQIGTGAAVHDDSRYKRPLLRDGEGATRCRTFHSRLNDSAIAYMNDQLNAWVDSHPEIIIKFGTATIGVFEGKHSEPNLILTIFY